MNTPRNRRIVLAARPDGAPKPSDFRMEETEAPSPVEGQMLLRNLYLSLDPYMRGRMNAGRSYASPVEVGEVMVGGTVSEVAASCHPDFKEGDVVVGYAGWQDYALSNGAGLMKLDPTAAPITTSLGVMGMPGLTAYVGLLSIGRPKPGETVVVAAATGPVGSAVGQIARIKGARAVGVAGGDDKRRALIEEFGFDVALDHRAPDFAAALAEACPSGIDVYFENVGGPVFSAVMPLLNDFARVPVCGLVANYNDRGAPAAPDRTPLLMRQILSQRLTVQGFIVSDHFDQQPAFMRDMSGWVREGRVRYLEDIVEGLDAAPAALIGLLEGRNFGKLLVRLANPAD